MLRKWKKAFIVKNKNMTMQKPLGRFCRYFKTDCPRSTVQYSGANHTFKQEKK